MEKKKKKEKKGQKAARFRHLENSWELLRLQGEEGSLRQLQNSSSSVGKGVGRGWSGLMPT